MAPCCIVQAHLYSLSTSVVDRLGSARKVPPNRHPIPGERVLLPSEASLKWIIIEDWRRVRSIIFSLSLLKVSVCNYITWKLTGVEPHTCQLKLKYYQKINNTQVKYLITYCIWLFVRASFTLDIIFWTRSYPSRRPVNSLETFATKSTIVTKINIKKT